ncbi:MAG: urease accessory protein UreG [Candidatus Limnocylindrales bacterium]
MSGSRPTLRVGIGGPIGSGKTTLVAELCARLRDRYSVAAVTNDVNALEDARTLVRIGALPGDRVVGLDAGDLPDTDVSDDVAQTLAAVDELIARHADLDAVFIEGGDDLGASTFDPELIDLVIYVLDVSAGEKATRRGAPGIIESDLLVINKADLAPAVGASLMNMERDAISVRQDRPFVFTNLRGGDGVDKVADFVVEQGMLE